MALSHLRQGALSSRFSRTACNAASVLLYSHSGSGDFAGFCSSFFRFSSASPPISCGIPLPIPATGCITTSDFCIGNCGARVPPHAIYSFLQIVSSVAGVLILCLWIRSWYRTTRPAPQPFEIPLRSASKALILTVIVIVSVVGGLLRALLRTGIPHETYILDPFAADADSHCCRLNVVAAGGMGSVDARWIGGKCARIGTHQPLVRADRHSSALPTPFSLFPVFSPDAHLRRHRRRAVRPGVRQLSQRMPHPLDSQ